MTKDEEACHLPILQEGDESGSSKMSGNITAPQSKPCRSSLWPAIACLSWIGMIYLIVVQRATPLQASGSRELVMSNERPHDDLLVTLPAPNQTVVVVSVPAFDSLFMAEECRPGRPRKFFVDLGARNGDSLAAFLKSRPQATSYCALLIEASPRWEDDLSIATASLDGRAAALIGAASCINGHTNFHVDTEHKQGEDAPSGHREGEASSMYGGSSYHGNTDVLQTIRTYSIPDVFLTYFTKEDYVLVKMDVEGVLVWWDDNPFLPFVIRWLMPFIQIMHVAIPFLP